MSEAVLVTIPRGDFTDKFCGIFELFFLLLSCDLLKLIIEYQYSYTYTYIVYAYTKKSSPNEGKKIKLQ
jgi:hypothetical protein